MKIPAFFAIENICYNANYKFFNSAGILDRHILFVHFCKNERHGAGGILFPYPKQEKEDFIMNQKNFYKNITGTHMENAPKSTRKQTRNRFLSYRFEIIDDENIYSISFREKLADEETQEMLKSIQNCLYERISDAIHMYLEQNSIAYKDFIASRKPLGHNSTMEHARMVLHSKTFNKLDIHTANADIYYAIIDHQQSDNKGNCKGCYIVVQKTPVLSKCQHKYSIIGQTFSYSETNNNEYGYFAIRENKENEPINNIALSSGETVLPSFGFIDLVSLLLNIDSIQTSEQVVKIALK